MRKRTKVIAIAAVAAAAIAVGAGIANAQSGGATPRALYYCAVSGHGVPDQWFTTPSTNGCPAGQNLYILGAQGPAGPQGPAGTNYQPVTASAQTDIINDPDSGNHLNWATDTLVRQMTVTRHGQVAVSNCGGNATNGITSCWYYTALMSDSGSFITIPGAKSPNAGVTINGQLSGTLTGGSSFEFYADSNVPDATNVPLSLDGSKDQIGSYYWPERFFSSGTHFGGLNEINWSYTYNAPTTCEQWIDAYNNSDGTDPGAGDIAGINACKA